MPEPKVLSPDLRDAIRSAARGNPWRYVRPQGAVTIGPLISPLRYDILIRAEFFELYAHHRAEFRSDPDAFAERASGHAYRAWFDHVYIRRWRPHLADRPDALRQEWLLRLRSAAALYDSFEASGFDTRHPITLQAGLRVQLGPSNAQLRRRLFAGDGNHRIALLFAAGHHQLEADQFRIKQFLTLRPADTTAALAEVLPRDPRHDAAFLALGACDE